MSLPEQDLRGETLTKTCLREPALALIHSLAQKERRTAFVVGGAIRDLLLGLKPVDFDIAGSVAEESFVREVANHLGASWFRLDHRQTVFRIVRKADDEAGRFIDFTGLRGPTIREDLRRRDFTINSMALDLFHPERGLIDPLNGESDLRQRLLRLSDPSAFEDDPLRILRAYRFAAQIGARLDLNLQRALKTNSGLKAVSGERVRDEWNLILDGERASSIVRDMDRDGVLSVLFPFIDRMRGVSQNEYHHLDVWEHSLFALERLEQHIRTLQSIPVEHRSRVRDYLAEEMVPDRKRSFWLKLATLFHDVGKPECRFVDQGGRVRFFRHEFVGSERIVPLLARVAPARREAEWVRNLVRNHMRIGQILTLPRVTPRAMGRCVQRAGTDFWGWVLLFLADYEATLGPKSAGGDLSHVTPRLYNLTAIYIEKSLPDRRRAPLINGNDIRSIFELPPGPIYGKILRRIELGVIEGSIRTREEALGEARKIVEGVTGTTAAP
ncbi:MAG: CCA tRNA nucleotidyltransferase [Deltaproteobacteria bacterium]|nr:CCA tRNA nucleotidyltransferase [Deltaproteobacteria bacterium]